MYDVYSYGIFQTKTVYLYLLIGLLLNEFLQSEGIAEIKLSTKYH